MIGFKIKTVETSLMHAPKSSVDKHIVEIKQQVAQ